MKIMLFAIPVFFLLIGLELVFDRLKKTQLYHFPDTISNISTGVQQQLTGVLFKTILIAGYFWVYEHRIFTIPENWWSFALVFLGVDFFYYWFHRTTHEVSFLWGTHIVHHQSEEYNLSVALRQSAIQGFFSNFFYLPLAFLGFSPASFFLMATFQLLYQFWIHTRTIDKLPPVFEYIFNTPSHHRVHHGQNLKYLDKNHGGTLILFDRWFGTFQKEDDEVVYGVTVPLRSWNPVWAQFEYYFWLGKRLAAAPHFSDKMKMLFKKPGWMPDSPGGSAGSKSTRAGDFEKYQTSVGPLRHGYVLFNFVALIVMVFVFLKDPMAAAGLSFQNILICGWIFWTTASLSGVIEKKKWAVGSEVLRWAAAAAFVFLQQ